jgi:hypothetical protein
LFVLVNQAAEDLPAPYPRRRQVGDRACDAVAVVWWLLVPAPVRAMLVLVRDVLLQDRPQMPRPGEQHPVGDLRPGCTYPAFGISVAPHRQLHLIRSIGTGVSG